MLYFKALKPYNVMIMGAFTEILPSATKCMGSPQHKSCLFPVNRGTKMAKACQLDIVKGHGCAHACF